MIGVPKQTSKVTGQRGTACRQITLCMCSARYKLGIQFDKTGFLLQLPADAKPE